MLNKPLNLLTDLELINMVKKEANSEAFNEICFRCENLFYKIVHKYSFSLEANGLSVKDFLDEKNCLIYNCILSFNPQKGAKFSSWIGNCTRYACLNAMNSRKFIINSDSEDVTKFLEENQIKNEFSHKNNYLEQYKYAFNILNKIKDPRVKKIFEYRYAEGKKMIWATVAKKLSMSVQTAVNLHSKGIKLLKSKLNSKEVSDVI
jgi:RNA polymerase sigma factor (sigma-70 family)